MKKQNIYVLDGNPKESSLGRSLAETYAQGAEEAGHEVRMVRLNELDYDPILHWGYKRIQELEPDLQAQQENISWCDHWVIVTPVWWESTPALLKGFLDRVILPGFAFSFKDEGALIPGWEKLLTGRSARIIHTHNTPQWYVWLVRGDPFWHALKDGTLEFSGIHPVKRTNINPQAASDEKLNKRLAEVKRLGTEGK